MIDMVSSWRPPADHDAARRQRPRGRAAKKRDELAALHSITSSAAIRRTGVTEYRRSLRLRA
jgi:hypothetical protein